MSRAQMMMSTDPPREENQAGITLADDALADDALVNNALAEDTSRDGGVPPRVPTPPPAYSFPGKLLCPTSVHEADNTHRAQSTRSAEGHAGDPRDGSAQTRPSMR